MTPRASGHASPLPAAARAAGRWRLLRQLLRGQKRQQGSRRCQWQRRQLQQHLAGARRMSKHASAARGTPGQRLALERYLGQRQRLPVAERMQQRVEAAAIQPEWPPSLPALQGERCATQSRMAPPERLLQPLPMWLWLWRHHDGTCRRMGHHHTGGLQLAQLPEHELRPAQEKRPVTQLHRHD